MQDAQDTGRARGGRLAFYHPTAAGNGSAMRLDLRLDRDRDDGTGCFFLELSPQKEAASTDAARSRRAAFDWDRKITAKLEFMDVCELVAVLEGKKAEAGNGRGGLFHQTEKASTVVALKRMEGDGRCLVGLSRKDKSGGEPVRTHIVLNDVESLGLRSVLQTGLFYMVYHRDLRAPAAASRAPAGAGRERGVNVPAPGLP